MTTSTQKQFDFSRGQQLGIIRNWSTALPEKLAISEGARSVSIKKWAIIAMVRAIDCHAGKQGWCFVSFATFAAETGASVRTAKRVMVWLESESLVIKRRGRLTNHYRLCFPNLDDRGGGCQPPEKQATECHGNNTECHSDNTECHGDTYGVPPVAHKAQRSAKLKRYAVNAGGDRRERRKDMVSFGQIQWLTDRICRDVSVGKPNDFWLVKQVAALVHRRTIRESDLESVLESVRGNQAKIANPAAWFRGAIARRCFDGDPDKLDEALSSIHVRAAHEVSG